MDELELIKSLHKRYSKADLNEAETRFKIIDEILEKVLKWPKSENSVEFVINGNRADYLLKNKSGRPILIIESKRLGKYFDLPKNVNQDKNFQKITLDKLLSDPNIKDAVFQVKEYCEDLLCNYGAVCNGKVWIIFKVNSTNQNPWKKLPAFVIKDLGFFSSDYTAAINLLGYSNVVEKNSLQQEIGVSKKTYPELFYPKNTITAYDTPVNSNRYAGSLTALSRKYLGPIPTSDSDFMDNCYVSNKGHYDELQKNVQGFLHDSLTPYFKNQGFRDFSDNKEGGAFGNKIVKIIKQENLDNVMILFGGRGSGKSTFLKRFLFYIRPIEINMYSHVSLVDLIDSSQTSDSLTKEIWERVKVGIDKDQLFKAERETLLKLFADEFEVYNKQILKGLEENSSDYQSLIRDFLQKHLNDTKLFCEKISFEFKKKNKGLIIFLDNMDQLNTELQDLCYLTAVEIAKKLSCLVIISMREERFYNAKMKGALDAYHTPGYHLSAPVIPEVIIKRINYINEKLTYTADVDVEYGIESDQHLMTIQNFFKICSYQLNSKDSHLSNFLRYATHGDVRQALEFFKGFISSGYTNIDEVSENPYWVFQIHQVIKPMMIPDRLFYDEKLSRIPNIFKLRNDINSSHFTGIRILHQLENKYGNSSSGFVDAKFFLQEYEEQYLLVDDCVKHLDVFIAKGLIESSNRLEEFSEHVDQIKITAFGSYIYESLAFNFAYLDLICLDSGVYKEELNNYLASSANQELKLKQGHKILDRIKLRLERTERFITYLEEQEDEEFISMNFSPTEVRFATKMRQSFDAEKERILNSAKRNQN